MARSTWGSIRHRYDDLWEIRYADKYGENQSEYVRGSLSDAERRKAELRIEHEGADPKEPCTLDQFWTFVYHPEIVANLSPKTVEGYEQKYGHDIKPVFGGLLLEEIRPRDIQNWIYTMPPSTARHAKAVLSAMLSRAFALEYADDNPAARRFILPKTKPKRDKLTFEELKAIAFACQGEPWEAAYLGSSFGGMSRYETCGVQAPDVKDVDGYAVVALQRGVHRVKGEVVVRNALKNEYREREAVIEPPFSKRYLRLAKDAGIAAYENGWDAAWLTGDGFGNPMCPNQMAQAYKRWFLDKPYRYVSFSSLRPSYSTYMLEKGVDGSMVAKMMGNNERSTTEINYERPDGASFISALKKANG